MRSRSMLVVWLLAAGLCDPAAATDLVIRGGTVVDGTGRPGFVADVAIHDGKISAIGIVPITGQERIIDATALVVSPGFIDVHNHVPDTVLRGRPGPILVEAYVSQGVTTIVGGPDGLYSPSKLRAIKRAFDAQGIATNYAFYVGHNGIRQEVLGSAQRAPGSAELQRMADLAAEGMRMGAVGLSSGLMYEPGMFSTTDEVIALARAIKPYDGLYDTHTRDPVLHFLESDEEAIQIGRAAGIRVKIAHEKAVGLLNKGRIHDLIAMIDKERAAGHEVVTDQYPYDGAQLMALEDIVLLPDVRFDENDPAGLAKHRQDIRLALRDPRLHDRIREASEHGVAGGYSVIRAVGYGSLRIVASPGAPQLGGENIQLLAEHRHSTPFDLIAQLILSSTQSVLITIGSIDENDLRLLLQQPWNMIASDGGFVGPSEPGPDHPRTYGTYTRVLGHYSRDLHLLTLPEAIRKMTALPADFLHIGDRGRIAVGQAADIAIFDPKTIADRATYSNPTVRSVGVRYVIVNGTLIVDAGRQTSATPGRFVAPTRH